MTVGSRHAPNAKPRLAEAGAFCFRRRSKRSQANSKPRFDSIETEKALVARRCRYSGVPRPFRRDGDPGRRRVSIAVSEPFARVRRSLRPHVVVLGGVCHLHRRRSDQRDTDKCKDCLSHCRLLFVFRIVAGQSHLTSCVPRDLVLVLLPDNLRKRKKTINCQWTIQAYRPVVQLCSNMSS
jgi:hypothetical protein